MEYKEVRKKEGTTPEHTMQFVSRMRGKRDIRALTVEEFTDLVKEKKCTPGFTHQEYLTGDTRVRPYYDWDAKYQAVPEDLDFEKKVHLRDFKKVVEKLHPGERVVFAQRHGYLEEGKSYKISYRAFVCDSVMKAGNIPGHVRKTLGMGAKETHEHLDLGVYKKSQLLGVIYGCKDTDKVPRFLVPLDDSIDPCEYLVQNVTADAKEVISEATPVNSVRSSEQSAERLSTDTSPGASQETTGVSARRELLDACQEALGRKFFLQEPFDEILVRREDGDCLIVTTKEKYCDIARRKHSNNHPYLCINSEGCRQKCHNETCKAKGNPSIVPYGEMPASIRAFYEKEFLVETISPVYTAEQGEERWKAFRDGVWTDFDSTSVTGECARLVSCLKLDEIRNDSQRYRVGAVLRNESASHPDEAAGLEGLYVEMCRWCPGFDEAKARADWEKYSSTKSEKGKRKLEKGSLIRLAKQQNSERFAQVESFAKDRKFSQHLTEAFKCDDHWVRRQAAGSRRKQNDVIRYAPVTSTQCLVQPHLLHEGPCQCCVELNTSKKTVMIDCMNLAAPMNFASNHPSLVLLFGQIEVTSRDQTAVEGLIQDMLTVGEQQQLRRAEGTIYRPIEGKTCCYQPAEEYLTFVQETFEDDPAYQADPARSDKLVDVLRKTASSKMPFHRPDRAFIGFGNGVLNIETMTFWPHGEVPEEHRSVSVRHFIDQDVDVDDPKTPQWDALVTHQLENPEIACLFLAMIGRLFFPVGTDHFSLMLFIKGRARTGKSTILDAIQEMFNPSQVATLSAKGEETFGLGGKENMELIVWEDLPKDTERTLPGTTFQSMVSGGSVDVRHKGSQSKRIKWTVPQVAAGNVFPNWPDNSGSIYRRVLTFMFDKPLARADKRIRDDILHKELGNVCFRAVKEYKNLLEDERFTDGDFYDNCPEYFKRTKDLYIRDKDPVYLFLTGAYFPGYIVERDEKGCVEVSVLRQAWMAYSESGGRVTQFPKDDAWEKHDVKFKQENICKGCTKPHRSGCCKQYARTNRTNLKMAFGLSIALDET